MSIAPHNANTSASLYNPFNASAGPNASSGSRMPRSVAEVINKRNEQVFRDFTTATQKCTGQYGNKYDQYLTFINCATEVGQALCMRSKHPGECTIGAGRKAEEIGRQTSGRNLSGAETNQKEIEKQAQNVYRETPLRKQRNEALDDYLREVVPKEHRHSSNATVAYIRGDVGLHAGWDAEVKLALSRDAVGTIKALNELYTYKPKSMTRGAFDTLMAKYREQKQGDYGDSFFKHRRMGMLNAAAKRVVVKSTDPTV